MTNTSDLYLKDLLQFEETQDKGSSEIVEFFTGSNVFITGSTGFVGSLLIEKLLRCCPKIGNVFVLIRPKKGKSPEERLKKLLDNVLYNRVKKEQPDSLSHIVLIKGNIQEKGLGLSNEDRAVLRNTNVVIHAAASVRFNEPLRQATNTNVRATRELLLFAKEMLNLQAFVYISTAFSHTERKFIDEKLYPAGMHPEDLIKLIEILNDEQLAKLLPRLLKGWPNTYGFTKAIAEEAVRIYGPDLPVCIVRPSIILSTDSDPIAGWTNNFYGITGCCAGAGLGLLRTVNCDPEKPAEAIPADYVVACILAAAWEMKSKSQSIAVAPDDQIPVYNMVSSTQNSITFEYFMKCTESHGFEIASNKSMWKYLLILEKRVWLYSIITVLLQTVPAYIVDAILLLRRKKPMLVKIYEKVYIFSEGISFYARNRWYWSDNRVQNLFKKLKPVDQEMFNFDVAALNWDSFLKSHIRGIRVYLLDDPLDEENIKKGLRRYRRLEILHYTVVAVLILGFAFLLSLFF